MPPIRFRPGRSRRRLAPLWLAAALLRVSGACRRQAGHARGRGRAQSLDRQIFACGSGRRRSGCDGDAGGSHYLVSADLSALNALLAETGVSYDPAVIAYKAVEQDDGNWRVAIDSLPRIGFHSKDASGSLELTNFRSTALISPAIAWLLSGSGSMTKARSRFRTRRSPSRSISDRLRRRSRPMWAPTARYRRR